MTWIKARRIVKTYVSHTCVQSLLPRLELQTHLVWFVPHLFSTPLMQPGTPDDRVRPDWPSTRGGGLWNKRYQKRYEKLKIWFPGRRIPRPVLRDASVQMWPIPVMVPQHVPVPVPNPVPEPSEDESEDWLFNIDESEDRPE